MAKQSTAYLSYGAVFSIQLNLKSKTKGIRKSNLLSRQNLRLNLIKLMLTTGLISLQRLALSSAEKLANCLEYWRKPQSFDGLRIVFETLSWSSHQAFRNGDSILEENLSAGGTFLCLYLINQQRFPLQCTWEKPPRNLGLDLKLSYISTQKQQQQHLQESRDTQEEARF